MRKYFLFVFLIFYIFNGYSQLFFQDFQSSNRLNGYIGLEKNKFVTISSFKNSLAKVDNQALSFSKIGGSSSFFTVGYTTSTAIQLSFDVDVAVIEPMDLNESHRGSFLIGGGADESWTEKTPKQPQNERVHTRIMFNVSYTENNTPQYSFANSTTQFKGKQKIVIVSNNTGSTLKYKGPDHKENTVKDRGYDLWVGHVLVMNDATAIGKNTTLEYLKFLYPPKSPNCRLIFDNILIEDLSGSGARHATAAVQAKPADSNVLWSWQFTFPTESKGREIAFPATYVKDGLGQAILSRGLNAVPGSGSVRGFTADFPIDGNISHAKKSGSYYEFVLNVGKGKSIDLESIDVILRRQQESPYIYQWAYSLDGKKFVDIGDKSIEITSLENLGVKQAPLDLKSITDLRTVSGKVYFRLYAWGGTSMSGGNRSFGFGKSDTQGSEVIVFKGKIN